MVSPRQATCSRDLIPELAQTYHVIAPDLPGFGNTNAPPRGDFTYSFDNLARIIQGFTEALGLDRYALYIFDYGAPVGLRLAMAHPERVTAIVSQNGNAYLEGLSDAWQPWRDYWASPTPEHREACRISLAPETIRTIQYLHGADTSRVSPDGYTLDIAYMARSRRRGDPARPDPGLCQQPGTVPGIPGLFQGAPATVARNLGAQRSAFPAPRRRGLPPRPAGRGGQAAGRRPFRAGDARSRNRRRHAPVSCRSPRTRTQTNDQLQAATSPSRQR